MRTTARGTHRGTEAARFHREVVGYSCRPSSREAERLATPGANRIFSVADAASCAFAPCFLQDPSFLAFQRRMQEEEARSDCQSLFGIEHIPTDNCSTCWSRSVRGCWAG